MGTFWGEWSHWRYRLPREAQGGNLVVRRVLLNLLVAL